jgi:hypothetical protein
MRQKIGLDQVPDSSPGARVLSRKQVSAPAVNWFPGPLEMPGLSTKIPVRNKNNLSCLNEYRKKKVED